LLGINDVELGKGGSVVGVGNSRPHTVGDDAIDAEIGRFFMGAVVNFGTLRGHGEGGVVGANVLPEVLGVGRIVGEQVDHFSWALGEAR